MNHKTSIYRLTLKFQAIALMALLISSVAFIGCPEAEQMTDNVISPPDEVDPNKDPNVDPNADPNEDPNEDPNKDPNIDPNADPTQ